MPDSLRPNVAFGTQGVRSTMPDGTELAGVLPAVSRHQRYTVAHLYGSSVGDPRNLTEDEKLYFGLHLLAVHEQGREAALEIESMRGIREFVVLTRSGGSLVGQVQDGLKVTDLATTDDTFAAKQDFYKDVRRLLARALERIRSASIEPIKGDPCEWCDFGELCRRSRAYGEEDSPFGRDQGDDDV
jgi:hypothetical protein